MVVIDTSVLIDYLRRPEDPETFFAEFVSLNKSNLAISMLTIQELYSGKSSKEGEKEKLFLEIITSMEILPYTYQIAKLAGEIFRDRRENMGFADAAIAATAILNKASLLTLNKKDFKGIKNLKLI